MKYLGVVSYCGPLHGPEHALVCCLCGERERKRLVVEDLGLSVGMSGDDYSFCKKCWNGPDLGKKILILLGFKKGIKLLNDRVVLRTIP